MNHRGRLIKNIGFLYIRMFFIMGVTLYISRLTLNILGTVDYGIYYLVGGFVTLLGFLHGAMSSATQRFYSYEIGKNNGEDLSDIFSTSLNIHLLLVLIIVVFSETIGIWIVSNYLKIPDDRFYSAVYAYHFAVLSFAATVLTVPFTALIMAYERMNVYSFISIIDVFLKLSAVLALQVIFDDKLVGYAILLLIIAIIVLIIYFIYCKISFENVKYSGWGKKDRFYEILKYTAWNTWGNLSSVLSTQGGNVLINIFFGPSLNAARAVSFQASSALKSFMQSIQTAINPQIIKLYASNEIDRMNCFIIIGCKANFYLLLFISLPFIIHTNEILSLWLINVPDYTVIFLRLIIISNLIDSISSPLMTACQATGKIKKYQITIGSILLLNLPLSYLFLNYNYPPYIIMVVAIFTSIVALFSRIYIIKNLIELPLKKFFINVIFKMLLVSSVIYSISKVNYIKLYNDSSILIFSNTLYMMLVLLTIFFVGLDLRERMMIIEQLNKIKLKLKLIC